MELPVDEKDDKQVVRVPEALEVGPPPLLYREPDHGAQSEPHDPSSDPRTGCEVGQQEHDDSLLGRIRRRDSEVGKVDHVGDSVNYRPEDNGPGSGLMEGDILVEGNDVVQRCSAQHGDEVPANREQDEGSINMEDESSSAGDN